VRCVVCVADLTRDSAAVGDLVSVLARQILIWRASGSVARRRLAPRGCFTGRAAATYAASAFRSAAAFLASRSISYDVPSSANNTVSPLPADLLAIQVVDEVDLGALDHCWCSWWCSWVCCTQHRIRRASRRSDATSGWSAGQLDPRRTRRRVPDVDHDDRLSCCLLPVDCRGTAATQYELGVENGLVVRRRGVVRVFRTHQRGLQFAMAEPLLDVRAPTRP
jgi:hypothetical protein